MREQSHLEDMRAAVRGDLERARARRPSIFERPAAPPEPEELEPVPEPEPEPTPEVEPEPELTAEPEPEPVPVSPAERRRLLDRLAFWRR